MLAGVSAPHVLMGCVSRLESLGNSNYVVTHIGCGVRCEHPRLAVCSSIILVFDMDNFLGGVEVSITAHYVADMGTIYDNCPSA